jgi:WASH complex subunit FAM21
MEDIKNSVNTWNLGDDVKLLNYLNGFSASLTDRSKKLINNIEELASDTVEADVRLRNTFNEFLMLANSQFIENVRVQHKYDL